MGTSLLKKPGGNLSDEHRLALWQKYEDVAMHFNDLIMRWRLQAVGGLAAIVTAVGFASSETAQLVMRYRTLRLASFTLIFAWTAVAAIDLFYYRRLLEGAVSALRDLEKGTYITLTGTVDNEALGGGVWAPYAFYGLVYVPLLVVCGYSWYQVAYALPPP